MCGVDAASSRRQGGRRPGPLRRCSGTTSCCKDPSISARLPTCDPSQIRAYLDLLLTDFLRLFRPLLLRLLFRARVDRMLDFFAAFFLPAFPDPFLLPR
jgi:hypothetical protein